MKRARWYVPAVTRLDVVVVSYNSRDALRACVEPLSRLDWAHVVVVDNDSADGSLESVADLPIERIARADNGGFSKGCNDGWRAGSAPYVCFLNPDATIDGPSLERLVAVLDEDDRVGAVAPRIEHPDGSISFSLRRFPRLRSTYARALFLHRLFPGAAWTDELVRDEQEYTHPGCPEWVSGAVVVLPRAVLEELGGWDEGFFLYSEDIDLCRRVWRSGRQVRFEPEAVAVHEGGASSPGGVTLPYLVASRIRYAEKHRSRLYSLLERLGVGIEELLRVLVSRGGFRARAAHARSLRLVLSRSRAG